MEQVKKRVATYDIMKFFGIIMVIVGHMTDHLSTFIFSFHMPLFFIIAGYFYHEKEIAKELHSDVKRLVHPYLFTGLVVLLTYLLLSLFKNNVGVKYWLIALIYGNGSSNHSSLYLANVPNMGAIWFLLALFWCKTLFNILYHHSKHWFIISLCASGLAILIDSKVINLPWGFLPGIGAMMFYAFGHFVKLKGGFLQINPFVWTLCILVWFVSFLISDMSMVRCYYHDILINVIGALGGTYMLYLISDLVSTTNTKATKIVIWGAK